MVVVVVGRAATVCTYVHDAREEAAVDVGGGLLDGDDRVELLQQEERHLYG